MSELWEAVKPWLPWLVPAAVVALAFMFFCAMVWPSRFAQAMGILAITWDSFAKRFRRARGKTEPVEPEQPRRSTPMPPTISGFAIPAPKRRDKNDDAPEPD